MERLFAGLPPPAISLPGCPLLAKPVPAGFPSPADDYAEGRVDLNQHLIAEPEATFLVRATGDSMLGFGIHDGDTLVVDRSTEPADRNIVVAMIDGEFTVKQFCRLPAGCLLRAGSPAHRDILVDAEQQFSIWGVVRWSLHRL
ncbi:MAG: translesion error-prone DNA polymerase V autoproteolytic subunit [Betaproteobacteria bacterium]|nr:translesion error-prone DNA polymerase V autoproteolytic subunit [Betaproteobacteria bacterium]